MKQHFLATRILRTTLFLSIAVLGTHVSAQNLALNPGFESGTSDWSAFGSSISTQSGQVHSGALAAQVSNRNSGTWNGIGQNLTNALVDGETYQISAWVRLVSGSSEPVALTMRKQENGGVSQYVSVAGGTATSTGWTQISGAYDLNVSGTLDDLFLYMEGPAQGVEFFTDDWSVESIGASDWLAEANARIEMIRKRDVRLNLVDPQGNPVNGVGLDVTQTRRRFGFGSAINFNISNAQYRNFFTNNFEWAVMENESKWYSNESTQGNVTYTTADSIVSFCDENDITLRGHTIFWAPEQWSPAWVQALTGQPLMNAVSNRLDSVVTHFADTFVHWDVNNEMLHGSFFADNLGASIRPWMFNQARSLDSDVMLFVNDYSVVSGGETEAYKTQIQDLITAGAEINGIGAQGHFGASVSPTLTELRIDSLAELGLPIWISEYDSSNADENIRADNLETLYRMAFSKQAVEGIMMWGFWEDSHWRANAHIVNSDWSLNAAGVRYQSLMAEWTTLTSGASNVSGEYDFRGFHGSYDVILTPPGELSTLRRFTLEPGAGTQDVTMIVHLGGDKPLLHSVAHSGASDEFSFQVTGDAGSTFEIQSATSMVASNWVPISTEYNAEGTILYTNPAPSVDHLIFRAEASQ